MPRQRGSENTEVKKFKNKDNKRIRRVENVVGRKAVRGTKKAVMSGESRRFSEVFGVFRKRSDLLC